MRLARRSCFLIAWIVAGIPSTVAAQERAVDHGDVYFGCGKPQPVAGYEFRAGAHRFLLPRHVVISRNGQSIYSSGEQTGWEPPYRNAVFATSGTDVLIVAETTDCIDLTTRHLYLVRSDGNVIHQPIWTSNWKDGFFLEAGRLTYWSEWFCRAENTDRRAGLSYVFWFDDARGAFERRDVPEALYCGKSPEDRFLKFGEPTRLVAKAR